MDHLKASAITLAVLPLLVLAAPAQAAGGRYGDRSYDDAETGAYIGFSFGQFNYKEEGLGNITPNVGLFRFGADLNRNLAIEGRVGGGLFTADNNGYGLRVPSLYAGYLKGIVPVNPAFSLYGLAGFASAQLERDYGPVYTVRDSSVSYGVGAEFNLRRGTVLNAEYVRLLTGNNGPYDYTVDLGTIGFAWHF